MDSTFKDQVAACFYGLACILDTVPECDVEQTEESLELILPDGRLYLFTCHAPTQQIWVASPFTGAHHFSFQQDVWRHVRSFQELKDFLSEDCPVLKKHFKNCQL